MSSNEDNEEETNEIESSDIEATTESAGVVTQDDEEESEDDSEVSVDVPEVENEESEGDSEEKTEDDGHSDSNEEDHSGTVYLYRVPVEDDGGVRKPTYGDSVSGKVYLHHTAGNYRYIIQENAASHFHKDDVNVDVTELDKEEVVKSDNKLRDFVKNR